jgi:(p)ppGpp synthase/HD superfamily hydrolase
MGKDLLLALDKQISYTTFLRKAYPEQRKAIHAPKTKPKEVESSVTNQVAIIDTDKRLPYSLCETCNPKPPLRIVARTGKDGIKVHNVSCSGIKTVPTSRLLESHREHSEPTKYKVEIVVELVNRHRNLVDLM